MNFIKESADKKAIVDTVFSIVSKAKKAKAIYGADQVVDATIGSLYSENEELVAYQTVFKNYDAIDSRTKAAYAASFTGNPSFREKVYEWTLKQGACTLAHSVIATPGGTGAVNMVMNEVIEIGESVILPDIAWGSYNLMAKQNGQKIVQYSMFEEDHFNLASLKQCVESIVDQQNRILVVINDPCHNPTGYTMAREEWRQVIEYLNEVGKKKPVVILNDIAYIDYAYDLAHSRDFMQTFNQVSENVMIVIAFSCSKTMTSYGLRCGAAVICAQNPESVRNAEIVFEKSARATWSNIPNAAMENFTEVLSNYYQEFMNEKAGYIQLLKQRSDIFVNEANQVGLPIYPYVEGFFVTIKIEDSKQRDAFHELCMKNNIFTVVVNKGIRVAVCSLPIAKAQGLAKRMKELMDEIKGK